MVAAAADEVDRLEVQGYISSPAISDTIHQDRRLSSFLNKRLEYFKGKHSLPEVLLLLYDIPFTHKCDCLA